MNALNIYRRWKLFYDLNLGFIHLYSSFGHWNGIFPLEPPKRLGPGALISIARQLGPNLARTGSSSSEASIKATLFQYREDNTHTKVSPEITTQNISNISVIAAEDKFITNQVQSSKVLQSSTTQIIQGVTTY